jgi:mannose-6-phosphate isomerase
MVKSPVRFEPLLKEKIWGGDKLKKLLNRESDSKILGES